MKENAAQAEAMVVNVEEMQVVKTAEEGSLVTSTVVAEVEA